MCFSLTNALPVLDVQQKYFILSSFKKGNVISQCLHVVTVLCLLSQQKLISGRQFVQGLTYVDIFLGFRKIRQYI